MTDTEPTTTPEPTAASTTTSTTSTTLAAGPDADMVIRGGVVLTMDTDQPLAESIAIRDGEIVAVGDDAELNALIGPDTEVVDIDGRAVIPGFVDAHAHYYGAALSNGEDLTDIQDHMLAAGVTTMGEASVDGRLLSEMQRLDGDGLLRVRSSPTDTDVRINHSVPSSRANVVLFHQVPRTGERTRCARCP